MKIKFFVIIIYIYKFYYFLFLYIYILRYIKFHFKIQCNHNSKIINVKNNFKFKLFLYYVNIYIFKKIIFKTYLN